VTNTVLIPKGAASLGIDWADIDAKYRTLVPNAPMPRERIEASLAAIRQLRAAPGISALIAQLS